LRAGTAEGKVAMGDGDRQPGEGRERLIFERNLSRRELLRGAAAVGATAGLSGILAACGGGGEEELAPTAAATTAAGETTEPAATTAVESEIKTGGRLRVGHVGGGEAESFDPGRGSSFIDASRYFNVYDPLTRVNPDLSIAPGLAVEWEPNADATVWQVKLRPDVVWHDGSAFGADDVIYSFQVMADPAHVGHAGVTNIKLKEVKKVDDLTLELPLKAPNAAPWLSFVQQNNVIVKNGTKDYAKPIGTGPFMVTEFTVGERSLATRNPNYWEEGKPYVDEWEDISISDNAARLNALLDGQIDMLSQLDFIQAKAQQEQGQIQVIDAESPSINVFLMAVDEPPFDDVRVRQAFRLMADRNALIETVFAGFGSPGNDLAGKGLNYFAEDLPVREQDLEQAKSLLAEAGQDGLEVTLHTSTIVPGFVEAATLFAEQAKGAGVKVNVKKEDPNAYFDTSLLYTHIPFGQSFWTLTALPTWYEQALFSDAVWNETHWRDPAYDDLIRQAEGELDETRATELWHEIQQKQYDEGGYIVWANQHLVDAAANYVMGIVPSSFFNLGGWNYRDVWLDQ
jgi:peptide/nickel transport system substrate-binding protein